jgi:hypothetical protein
MAWIHLQHFQVHCSRRCGTAGAVVLCRNLHHGHQKLRHGDKGSGKGTGHRITSGKAVFKILPADTITALRLIFT